MPRQHLTGGRAHGTLLTNLRQRLKASPGIVLAVPRMTRLYWMVRQNLTYGRARPDEQQIRELGDFFDLEA